MTQIRREPLADQAARALFERIRGGEWSLGAKLPGETTLGPQLGVGRSTVREAIRQLAGRGVLETRQGAGVFVTALDAPEDWGAVLGRADIAAVIEARIAIESEGAHLAAERRSPAAIRRIRRALAERGGAHDTREEYVDADMRFHRAVVEAADNPVLLELFDAFVPRLRRAMIDMLRIHRHTDDDVDRDAHADLAEAIADRDGARARELSRAHLRGLIDALG
ncbi:GntR family transcriptional regulator [Microbacterium nanhaiense]|uniref:GntR family transcriptional regulator n=1 Tax=Microbacterium nanhaiense TaxID=1301026 RepID=A0ABQ2N158_9MICO|nr:FadR/GntR family transcriptional regulator [Microbacterium nanhaiense]GGO62727.1 GntR family transcriptional regulator [Microbacterium nanhaiense]